MSNRNPQSDQDTAPKDSGARHLIIGVVTALVLGSAYREVVSLVLFLLVLMIRPQGLFGR